MATEGKWRISQTSDVLDFSQDVVGHLRHLVVLHVIFVLKSDPGIFDGLELQSI